VYSVYRIKNIYNGKVYVGSTVNFRQRIHAHFNRAKAGTHSNRKFQKDYIRYGGKDAFEVMLLCTASTVEDKFRFEDIFIKGYNAEYNILPNAGTQRGRTYTNATKKKMSEAAIRRGSTPEQLKRFSQLSTGRIHSAEEREKRRQTHLRLHAEGKIDSFKKVSDGVAFDIMRAHGKGFSRRTLSELLNIPLSTINSISTGTTRKRIYKQYLESLGDNAPTL